MRRIHPSRTYPNTHLGAAFNEGRNRVLVSVFAGFFVFGTSITVYAQERPTLNGSWSASGISERWAIGEWGENCGPKPAAKGAGGGGITVTESGGELAFSGGGYPRTNGCFEMGGGISVASHSASPRFWRTICTTPANDPRKARIVTTLQATDSQISFDETGEYQFVINAQNCTASVRRSRTYSLIRREGEPPPGEATASAAPSSAPAVTATATATATATSTATSTATASQCTTLGEPARVEVRPKKKLMKPGETFTFRTALFDENNCELPAAPQWVVLDSNSGVTVNSAGLVTVADGASDGSVNLQVSVKNKTLQVQVEVVSAAKYSSLLKEQGMNSSGESEESVSSVIATGGLGGEAAAAQTAAQFRRRVFFGAISVIALVLGAVGLVLWRRSKKQAPEVFEQEEIIQHDPTKKVVQKKRIVAKPKPATTPAPHVVPPVVALPQTEWVCPKCGLRQADGGFCHEDGARLVETASNTVKTAVSNNVQPPLATSPSPGVTKVCPVCGRTYPPEVSFCGEEGATLVQINARLPTFSSQRLRVHCPL